jgi:hypothetical protein
MKSLRGLSESKAFKPQRRLSESPFAAHEQKKLSLTNERKLLDERKKTSRSFFIFSWRVSYPSNDCTHTKKSRQQREACCRERLGFMI